MFCVLLTGGLNSRGCFRTAEACDKFRESDSSRSACVEHAGAACFNSTAVVTQERRAIGFPTIKECEQILLDRQRVK